MKVNLLPTAVVHPESLCCVVYVIVTAVSCPCAVSFTFLLFLEWELKRHLRNRASVSALPKRALPQVTGFDRSELKQNKLLNLNI